MMIIMMIILMIILIVFVMTKLMEIELVMTDIVNDIASDIAINDDKTSYISELTTTHLVKQDDVGMTVVIGIASDIGHGDLLS